MDKLKKFAVLDEIQLSQAEAEEYFAKKNSAKGVREILPLLYFHDGKPEILNTFDESRKDEIWGIVVGDYAIRIVHETAKEYHEVINAVEAEAARYDISKSAMRLTSEDAFISSLEKAAAFSRTVLLLNFKGVHAEDWKGGEYWLDSQMGKSAYAFCPNTMSSRLVSVETGYCHARLVLILK